MTVRFHDLINLRSMKKNRLPFILGLTSGRIHPLVIGLLTCLFLFLVLTGVFLLEGLLLIPSNYASSAYMILTIGYVIFITRIIYNSHVKSFNRLLAASDLDEEAKLSYKQQIVNFRPMVVETLVAVAVGFFHAYLVSLNRVFNGSSDYIMYSIWIATDTMLLWLVITHSTALSVRNLRLMNKLSREIEIDILDMEKFMPLTKSGIISILGFIGAYSLLLIQDVSTLDLSGISIMPLLTNPAIIPLVPSILWMLITPLKGIRKRVSDAKEREIKLIDKAIEGDRKALEESRIGKNLENINVIDLINYKKMVQNTLEIPINLPTASRFIFYLIIPILTWIASSIVDKTISFIIG